MAPRTRAKRGDWIDSLDLKRAGGNCRLDFLGDWYRDPWAWPELDRIVNTLDRGKLRAATGSVGRVARIDVPKENFGSRPAVVLDLEDRVVYQALVDKLSEKVIGSLPDFCYGWRLSPEAPKQGVYARNDQQWTSYLKHITFLGTSEQHGLKTDIVSFFASVKIPHLVDRLVALGGKSDLVDALGKMLEEWDKVPSRGGLPQRSLASAVLAHVYLRPVDDFLGRTGRIDQISCWDQCVRWMDDIWVFGDEPGALRSIQVELQGRLRDLGLEMNIAKTHLLDPPQLSKDVLHHDEDYVDGTLITIENDSDGWRIDEAGGLAGILEEIRTSPESASRTRVRYLTTRLRKFQRFDEVSSLVELSHRMPHCADHLARLYRDSKKYMELAQWFCEYATSSYATFEWSIAQLATMFPSNDPAWLLESEPVFDRLAQFVERSPSIPLFAVACQRLASWNSSDARSIFRSVLDRTDHPQKRRVLALASILAGEERTWVRRALGEFAENAVTLDLLSDRNFKPLPVARDFAAT